MHGQSKTLVVGICTGAVVFGLLACNLTSRMSPGGQDGRVGRTESPRSPGTGEVPAEGAEEKDCALSPAPDPDASREQRAEVAVYFFDGWADSLSNFHFDGLVGGPFEGREPLSGWRTTPCSLEQQLVWARGYGVDLFIFLYYHMDSGANPAVQGDLNAALKYYRGLEDRHGVQFALMYTNEGQFRAAPDRWDEQVEEWAELFADASYYEVDGKPLFTLINAPAMREDFGEAGAAEALEQLRSAAREQGLPGVYIVGGVHPANGSLGQPDRTPNLADLAVDGYDAFTLYNYPYVQPPVEGARPFLDLAEAGRWIWDQWSGASPVDHLPVVMNGWDPRPWDEREPTTDRLVQYKRTPAAFGDFVQQAIVWTNGRPESKIRASHEAPLIVVSAWNELAEGNYLVPTQDDGHRYGLALAETLLAPRARIRSGIELEAGSTDEGRAVRGRLIDEVGRPIEGGRVVVNLRPLEGPGVLVEHKHAGNVPPWAEQALVGFRVNTEEAGPGPAEFSLNGVAYAEGGTDTGRIANRKFSRGGARWGIQGMAGVESEAGVGNVVRVEAAPDQAARLDSTRFEVTPGAEYEVTFEAKVAPRTDPTQYFMLIFFEGGSEGTRIRIPMESGSAVLGSGTADSSGRFELPFEVEGRAILEGTYEGDVEHWPAVTEIEVGSASE